MMAKHREDLEFSYEIARKQPPKENAGDGEGRWGLRGVHRRK